METHVQLQVLHVEHNISGVCHCLDEPQLCLAMWVTSEVKTRHWGRPVAVRVQGLHSGFHHAFNFLHRPMIVDPLYSP